ncbi:MAG: glycerol-3-phosphate 1-O-acyltransferase PlsY [Selenomonadaceae bacterium]|nr:glycerol-3-phosphate 1-O-acyltransferase PlsY [Selenomonadaceae bacterium]
MNVVIAILLSYLLGSIPNGLICGKLLWGVDLREHGSHNIGATNAWRTLGKGPGIVIFLLDFLKGFISVWLGMHLVGTPLSMVLCGIVAILGHSCSIFLKFKGGKGVATGLGVIAMLMPAVTLVVFLLWLGIVYATKYVSLGSCVAAVFVPIMAWLLGSPAEYIVFGVLAAILIVVRHKSNISRLLNGTESKIKAGHR